MIIVSACLAGVECRYNGKAFAIPTVVELVQNGKAIPVCPEILGHLPIPRLCAEQCDGRILSSEGHDLTKEYMAGAMVAVNIARAVGCKQAILKSKSPTCGCGLIYDGTFSGNLINGDGVFCQLLKKENIKVYTEDTILAV